MNKGRFEDLTLKRMVMPTFARNQPERGRGTRFRRDENGRRRSPLASKPVMIGSGWSFGSPRQPEPTPKLCPIDEKPGDIVERFFLEGMRPLLNRQVRSLAMWRRMFTGARKLEAVSHAMFGRLVRWRKDRIGGAVWYLDCELAEGYADVTSGRVREAEALPRSRRRVMVNGAQSAH